MFLRFKAKLHIESQIQRHASEKLRNNGIEVNAVSLSKIHIHINIYLKSH